MFKNTHLEYLSTNLREISCNWLEKDKEFQELGVSETTYLLQPNVGYLLKKMLWTMSY